MRNLLHSFLRFLGLTENTLNRIEIPRSRVKAKSSLPPQIYRQFSLKEIRAATHQFDSDLVIGQGGSGVVYKGFIVDGHGGTLVVAVKRLMGYSRLEEFRNEVQLLCQLRHQHLVSLIGFCDEENEMVLVYDYMSNGSLYDYLHGQATGHDPLSWKQRLEICIGAARGLHYLNTGAKRAVIHRDIKTKNILLDNQRVSKLSDFGLSKIGPFSMSNAPLEIELHHEDHGTTTMMAGTLAYMDPQVFISSLVTDKSDVYSFGVILFEVLCGRKAIFRIDMDEDRTHIICWVLEHLRNGTIYQTIDPYLRGKIAPSCSEKYLEIAFSCVHLQGKKRPALGEVEATLELALQLQNEADSQMECINTHGEVMYEEVHFSASPFSFCDYSANHIYLSSPHGNSSTYSFKSDTMDELQQLQGLSDYGASHISLSSPHGNSSMDSFETGTIE